MTALSDRQHDAFDNPAKMACREGNLRTLRGCLPRRELTSAMLLPDGAESQINAGFVGVHGAFEIYQGKKAAHRMANLRVILR